MERHHVRLKQTFGQQAAPWPGSFCRAPGPFEFRSSQSEGSHSVMTNDRHNPARRKPLAVLLIVLAAIIVFAVLAYAYASPYFVLDRLKRAADARDAETVNQYVDYPALRVSLKQQLTELLARRIDAQKREHPFAALGALIGMALIGPLVDDYATPDGVAALLNGMP